MKNNYKCYYEYTCVFWDEFSSALKKAHGIIYTSTMKKVIKKINEYYGEDNVDSVKIQGHEIGSVYDFNESVSFSLTVKEKEDITNG